MRIDVDIEGVTPLLMNRFTDESEVSVSSGHRPAFHSDTRGTPREQAMRTTYRDEKTGELYIPGPNIFAALVEAGKFHKVNKNRVTTQKSSLVPAGLRLPDLVASLSTSEFEVDSRRVRIPATGGCVMRHRARLDTWKTRFHLVMIGKMFDPQFIRTLVDDAGAKIGIGDYRPATRGPFGCFVVTGWNVEA